MYFVETPDGDTDASADTFEEALIAALDHHERGDFVITWGVEGVGDYRRIAYHSAFDPVERDLVMDSQLERPRVIRILEPAYVPSDMAPGDAVEMEFNRRTYTFVSMLAPEVETWDFAMERTSVRGCEYPAPIKSYVYGFRDTSWKNDVTDSIAFAIGAKGYLVFCQPTSLLAWSNEATERYMMLELMGVDDGKQLSVDEILAHHTIDYEADSVIDTNSPKELLDLIVQMSRAEDPAALRAHHLELGPSRESARKRAAAMSSHDDLYERAKLIRQEIDDDDLNINPRGRQARRNPSDEQLRLAKEKFEEFHRHEPTKIFTGKTAMPTRVRELGDALFVLYESTKNDPDTGLPVKDAIRYIHEHDSAGVCTYTPVKSGGVAVPSWLQETTSVVLLGKCLGYAWKDAKTGNERESKIRPAPELYTTPCGRALLVIQDRREVIALVWGGALGVEARGIVG